MSPFAYSLVQALLAGFNIRLTEAPKKPGKWAARYFAQATLAFIILWTINFFAMPARVGLFRGFWLPTTVGMLAQAGINAATSDDDEDSAAGAVVGGLAVLGLIGTQAGAIVLNSELVKHDEHKELLPTVVERNVSEIDAPPLDQSFVRLVPRQYAFEIANTLIPNEQVSTIVDPIAEYGTIQEVDGKMKWVFPQDQIPNSRRSQDVIMQDFGGVLPGYVIIDASNPNGTSEVRSEVPITVSPEAWWERDVHRIIRRAGHWEEMDDIYFVLDDDGNPFYVVPMLNPRFHTSGYVLEKVVLVDAQTGEVTSYDWHDGDKTAIPAFVDRVVPDDLALYWMQFYGATINGRWSQWPRWIFGGNKRNTWKPTSEDGSSLSFVFLQDGTQAWWTGITPMNSNAASLGSATVDSRTGEFIITRESGGKNESAAESALRSAAATGLSLDAGTLEVSHAISYYYGGQPVFIGGIYIQDARTGRLEYKGAAIVQKKGKARGFGKTLELALLDYDNSLIEQDQSSGVSSQTARDTIEGQIQGVYANPFTPGEVLIQVAGQSFIGNALTISKDQQIEIISYQPGDTIKLEYRVFEKRNHGKILRIVELNNVEQEFVGVTEAPAETAVDVSAEAPIEAE